MSNIQEKTIDNTLHLLYKNIGETPRERVVRFKNSNPEYKDLPMTYAGRLDPMAEGLLLVLSGDSLKEKDKYLGLEKTYTFEILWGFSTDTYDVLGKISSQSDTVPEELEIKEKSEKSIGKFEQSYPAYSSQPVFGKPLFQLAREGRLDEIEIPKHEVSILNANFISRRSVFGSELLKEIISNILKVTGDFRQEEISQKWHEVLDSELNKEFIIDKLTMTVSSGFYVRQFVSDLSNKFETSATTFHIKRHSIGNLHL